MQLIRVYFLHIRKPYGICRSCTQSVFWGRDRVASHKRGTCKTASSEEKEFFSTLKKGKEVEVIVKQKEPEPSQEPVVGIVTRSKSRDMQTMSVPVASTSKNTMVKYTDRLTGKDIDELDQLFAQFMFRCAISFRVADSKSLQAFIKKLRPAYTVPSAYRLRTSLLDCTYNEMKAKTDAFLRDASYYTMISDGWTNIKGEHLVNFMIQVPGKGPFFYKAIDTSSVVMSAEAVAAMIIDVAQEIGTQKWAALLTDNAPVMRKAWKIIMDAYPLVFANGCGAHVGNLLMKRICDDDNQSDLLQKCIKIVKFINNHVRLHCQFQECQRLFGIKSGLTMPEPTRFYTQFTCSKNVLINKKAIVCLFEDYESIVDSFGKKDTRDTIKDIVLDYIFWKDLKILNEDILEPIVKFISRLESDDSKLDHVYDHFLMLRSHFTEIKSISTSLKATILDEIKYYWGFLHTEAMGFAFVLNPKNLNRLDLMDGDDYEETVDRLEIYLKKYFITNSSPEEAEQAVKEMRQYFVMYAESSDSKKVNLTVSPFIFMFKTTFFLCRNDCYHMKHPGFGLWLEETGLSVLQRWH